jgi:hypothetical protein
MRLTIGRNNEAGDIVLSDPWMSAPLTEQESPDHIDTAFNSPIHSFIYYGRIIAKPPCLDNVKLN